MPADDDRFARMLEAIYEHGNVEQALRDIGLTSGTFYRRIAQDEAFAGEYARAKVAGLHRVADEMRAKLAEEPPRVSTQFGQHIDAGWVQWKRNQVDADKWLLSKLVPKVYGDKLTVAGDADNPFIVDVADAKAALAGRLGTAIAAAGASGVDRKPK